MVASLCHIALFKQVGMCSSAFKDDLKDDHTSVEPVNQKPVRFNMAFSAVFEIANQEMIPVFAFQRYFVNEFTNDGLDASGSAPRLIIRFKSFSKRLV